MTHVQFLRIKKLTGKAIIEVAARHNCREILAELGAASAGRIDPARVGLNYVLRGHETAAAVASEAQALMDAAGIKAMRKDAVRALEIIFSLPPNSSIDHEHFFNESVQWAGQYFAVPVISAIVHNDEAAPHCHVLLLPLVDGRMIGSDLMGGRAKLLALQADFHAQIGQRYGLTRQTTQKRPSAATRKRAIDSAFDVLEANSGLSASVLLALLVPHMGDPAPLLLALGLDMPTPTVIKGEFAKMMTKPCKPEKPIGFGQKKPIGFDGSAASQNNQTLSRVGFAISAPSSPPQNEPTTAIIGVTMTSIVTMAERHDDDSLTAPVESAPHHAEAQDSPALAAIAAHFSHETFQDAPDRQTTDTACGVVREHDGDQRAEYWDEQLGEFISPTVKASCQHHSLPWSRPPCNPSTVTAHLGRCEADDLPHEEATARTRRPEPNTTARSARSCER
jgi:hypothetical protein